MRGSRIIALGILLAILAGVLLVKVFPQWKDYYAAKERQRDYAASAEKVAQALRPAELSRAPRLKDGSFNPVPPVKAAVSDDPSTLVARMQWRERYLPYLKQVKPAESSPGFYVYPCLDLTPEGVGLPYTYGWRLTASAALAQWTDARLAGAGEPIHYGLPVLDEVNPSHQPTPEEWARQALEDPAAKAARYIVTGVYGYDAATKRYGLRITLLDRQAAGQARDLATTSSVTRGDFMQLAAAQRAMARAMADKLIAMGLAHSRPTPALKDLELDRELGEVARLLDASDSWAVMDGIDRALALAQLFPHETLPLQAAAYGLNALGWSTMSYADYNSYQTDFALRIHALSQVAMAMDNRPLLSLLNQADACVQLGYSHRPILGDLSSPLNRNIPPELANFRNIIAFNHGVGLNVEEALKLPWWQNLWTESAMSWFVPNSGNRDIYYQCLPHWATHDLYLQALLHGYSYRYDYKDMNQLRALMIASNYATAGTLAAEIAAMLVALGPGAEADALTQSLDEIVRSSSGKRGGLAGLFAVAPGLDRKTLDPLIQNRDYYGLRLFFIKTMSAWGPPESGGHPAYRVLAALESAAPKVLQNPERNTSLTAFTEFEFSPARRLQFTRVRDVLGPYLLAREYGEWLGVYDGLKEVATSYLQARPANAAACVDFHELLRSSRSEQDAEEIMQKCAKTHYEVYPLDTRGIYNLGECYYNAGRRPLGLAYLAAFTRTDPFVVSRNLSLGRFYAARGYHARAVEFLGDYLKDYPQRYDIADERAWSLCQMGHWMDREVRETFAKPAPLLPGNTPFHENNLTYLVDWAKDYKAAREAAQFYQRTSGSGSIRPTVWLAAIENADGNTTRALEILKQAQPPRVPDRLQQASIYVDLADAFLDLDRPDLAESYVEKAAAMDSWKGNVIMVMGRQAYAKGDYMGAIKEYEREIDRYGFSAGAFGWIMECLEKQGKRDRAIQMLEEKLKDDERCAYVGLWVRLLRYYSESKQTEKMKPAMDLIVQSPYRTRSLISKALGYYKKFQPQDAAAIEKRLDRIMAGPED